MIPEEQIRFIRSLVQSVTGVSLPEHVTVLPGDGLEVDIQKEGAVIRAEDVNALARGFFLLARAQKEQWGARAIRQHRHFSSCGVMVDVSRNAVLKMDAVKQYLNQLACLGMNLFMLYTEDTFEVPEYPAFGYLRGGYTLAQIREIDDYAASLGIEVVPCIQTLAHLTQFLQWREANSLADQPDILLIDAPETYDFIEAEIRAISGCVRSRRIHIGMDEAHGVGLGRYYAQHGPTDRFALLVRHLDRVVEICGKYGLSPMMWSDMFFRLGSPTSTYYDLHARVPQQVIDTLPPVGMVYWDYYHADDEMYEHMLTEHARMGQETIFAGGIWTWSGFLPQVKLTEESMRVGLKACARHRVNTVFATLWGDDGAETNVLLASSMLPIFSEACWQGENCEAEELIRAGECLTGLPRRVLDAWGDFYPDAEDHRPGKQLIWCDPLYPMLTLSGEDRLGAVLDRSRRALDTLAPYQDRLDCRYASALFEVCIQKAEWIGSLRDQYLAGNRAWLSDAAENRIPALHGAYRRLADLHRALWQRDNRRFGWETLALRYGGVMERLMDVQEELRAYLRGELPAIEELDAQPRGFRKVGGEFFRRFATPTAIN